MNGHNETGPPVQERDSTESTPDVRWADLVKHRASGIDG